VHTEEVCTVSAADFLHLRLPDADPRVQKADAMRSILAFNYQPLPAYMLMADDIVKHSWCS
jgi:hypothetical protein